MTKLARAASFYILFLGLFLFTRTTILAQSALDGFDPNANGMVNVVVVQPDGKILIGGDFTSLAPNGGVSVTRNRIARLNPDGTLDTAFNPNANGFVAAIALQADGKILVGGSFNGAGSIGGQPRNRIARLDAVTGLADSFDPNASGGVIDQAVRSITIQSDGKILVGGGFATIGGQSRNRLARLDATTGLADSFNPAVTGASVYAITVQVDGKILVGGMFSNIGGQTRSCIARLDAATALADSFNPNATSGGTTSVQSIAVQADGKILVGGGFTGIGSQGRNNIARLDATTSAADSFNPNAGSTVNSMVIQPNGSILVGGNFTTIGGQTRQYVARLDRSTGLADAFNPSPNAGGVVYSIGVQSDEKIVIGGEFTTLSPNGGSAVTRDRIARLEKDGGVDRTLDLNLGVVGTFIYAVAFQPDGKILIGGSFSFVLGVSRNGLARLNPDGTLDMGFYPHPNDFVNAITVQPDGKILIGGSFSSLAPNGGSSVTRPAIARLNADGTVDTAFNSFGSGTVYSIALQPDGKILVGGTFNGANSMGGQARNRIARLNSANGLADPFNPNANSIVTTIALQVDGKILVGGTFSGANSIGGQTRNYMARLDPTSGLADSFDPNPDGSPQSMMVQSDGKILLSGFTMIGGQPRNYIARLDPATGLPDSFDPNANSLAYSLLAQSDGKIIAAGGFTSIGGQVRNRIAKLDSITGAPDTYDPNADSTCDAAGLAPDGKILLGGHFIQNVGGQARSRFARLTNNTYPTQDLAVSQTSVSWARGGSSPQFWRVTFEDSTDGVNYNFLGNGTFSGSSWTLTGLNLSTQQNLYIRARGYYSGGYRNGSGSIAESVRNAFISPAGPTPTATSTLTPTNTASFTNTPTNTATNTATPTPTGGWVINEIHADPHASLGDANGDGVVDSSQDEFVELINNTGAAVNVSGWFLRDGDALRHAFAPGIVIPNNCGVVIFGGGTPTGGFGGMTAQVASSGFLDLNDGGDLVTLHNALGDIVELYFYSTEGGNDQSVTRNPDIIGPDPLVQHTTVGSGLRFSPGRKIDGTTFTGCAAPTNTATSTPTLTITATNTPTNTATNTPTSTSTPTPTICGTPGSLDTTFNGTGKVTTPIGSGNDLGLSTVIQPDGKTVVAGYARNTNDDFAVVRYNTDGALDTTFNGTGKVTTPVGTSSDQAYSIALQTDGKIVVAGYAVLGSADFAVVRYNSDGTLDTTFNATGKVTTAFAGFDDIAYSVAIQSDGKIVAAGYSYDGTKENFAVARYNSDGTLDTTFNGTGKVTTPIGSGSDLAQGVAIQGGKIVAAGYTSVASSHDFAVVRYNSDGTLDTTFNGTGKVTTPVGAGSDLAHAVAIQTDGRIVAAGTASGGGFAIVRYNDDGTLDTAFNGTGKFTTGAPGDSAYSVAIQTDGKILAAGTTFNGANNDFSTVRLNTNGTLDTTFNATGRVVTGFGGGDDLGASVAIQPNGRIVVAGYTNNGSNYDFGVVAYHQTGCITPTATSTPTNTGTNTPTPTPTSSGTPSISGVVTYGNSNAGTKFISNVMVTGTGSPNVFTTTAAPGGSAGQYTLTGFGAASYTVSLSKTTGVNGIASADAARIAQHVANTGPGVFTNDRQKVAADVTGNGAVSSQDAARIAQYVAAVSPMPTPNFTGQWRFFVPPGPTFPVGSSATSRTYSSVTSNITGEDYIGLLIGEVTGNWTPTAARPSGVAGRETSVPTGPERGIAVELPYLVSAVEKEIVVPINVQGIADKDVISYEFDLRYDPFVIQPLAAVADLNETTSRAFSVVTNATVPGLLRVVVYGAMPIGNDGVLLNLRFAAVGSAGSVSPLTFERIMFNEGEPPANVSDGTIQLF